MQLRLSHGLMLMAALSGMAAMPAAADTSGFRAPSGNIHCMYLSDENGEFLRCDIREMTNTPPPAPADCDLDWGGAFEMAADASKAARICHGDTVANDSLPVLDYGSSWQQGSFNCESAKTGISCRNELGAGWDLARAGQNLY